MDDKVREILRVRYAIEPVPEDVANTSLASQPESRQTAYDVAKESIVLLKNDGSLLPLSKEVRKIAVIGQNAVLATALGGVGAGVKAPYEITPLKGIQDKVGEEVEVVYCPGYKNFPGFRWWPVPAGSNPLEADAIDEPADPALLAEAVAAAADADVVIFVCGTNKSIETEGSDRQSILFPAGQNEVAAALAEANPNLVSVIISGGPLDLRELEPVSPAIVQGWWNGLEGGHALADVLFGDIAPSGKLPFTFPAQLEDSPAYAMGNFPNKVEAQGDLFTDQYRQDLGGQRGRRPMMAPDSKYTEGPLVGYRWFDTKGVKPMYAFGHGLSYVDFGYANISASAKKGTVKVTFDLTNEGEMDADEVAQLYVRRIDASVEWPDKELKAFGRIKLAAGETRRVTLEVPVDNLRYWSEEQGGWALEHGTVEILVGSASDDIRLKTTVKI